MEENAQLMEFKCVEFAEELMFGQWRRNPCLVNNEFYDGIRNKSGCKPPQGWHADTGDGEYCQYASR